MTDLSETIKAIKAETVKGFGDSWGRELAEKLEQFLLKLLPEYSEALGLDKAEILAALEKRRDYSAPNFYQEANLPSLKDVRVFNTLDELKPYIMRKEFRCPACGGISTDPYKCDTGLKITGGKICDWKAYGLFHTLGKGLRFTIREGFLDKPIIDEIFMPLDIEEAASTATVPA